MMGVTFNFLVWRWGKTLKLGLGDPLPKGKGQSLVSQIRLVENLGKDPVADKLLFNIINFLSK